jgi:AcrR family transcriptional regulator
MGRPRSHGKETAAALLEAAERIAATEGPGALSIRRIADEVGTTTRAVYSLFGAKDGLVAALAAHGFDLLAAGVAGLPVTDDPVADLVAAGAVVFRRFATEHPVLFRIGFQREGIPAHVVAQFDESRLAALGQLTARLDRLAAAGGLTCTPEQAALYFHALCEGLAALELRTAVPARDPDPWPAAIRALLLGLGREASPGRSGGPLEPAGLSD